MSDFEPGRPYGGWRRCLVDFVVFDTLGELLTARALDASTDVRWWLRNDPVVFKIDTPVGGFEPDFIYERNGTVTRGLLEIKGDFLWSGPDSKDQRKARAACAWTTAVNAAAKDNGDVPWEFAVVLAEDVPTAAHLDGLRAIARTRAP